MKNAGNEMRTVVDFLESAEAAVLELKRLRRRLDALDKRRGELCDRRGAAAKKLTQMIVNERARELELVGEEIENYQLVEKFVARLPESAQRTILRRRYLDVGKSWEEIREELAKDGLYYSQRHLQRLHAQALEAAQKLWNQEGEEGKTKERR